MEPIKPSEVVGKKREILPDAVVKVFNDLIVAKWDGRESLITQEEVVMQLTALDIVQQYIFEKHLLFHLLDVEDIYRQAGWKVEYNRPGYNESYKAYFVFSK